MNKSLEKTNDMKPIDIEQSKQLQLAIMQDVHDFCQAHGIRYTLGYGTLLGAVRHGGFIPWDDDIDILMPRADYEKFIAAYNDGHADNYVCHSLETDKNYALPFAKVEDKRTVLEEKTALKPLGVSIDVFPLDTLADTMEESAHMLNAILRRRNIYKGRTLRPTPLNSTVKKIGLTILNLLTAPFPAPSIARWYERICRCGKPQARFMAVTVWGYGKREIMPSEMFHEYAPIKFEDRRFMAITDYHRYLTNLYGDYMTPPPEGSRHSPHTVLRIYWKETQPQG